MCTVHDLHKVNLVIVFRCIWFPFLFSFHEKHAFLSLFLFVGFSFYPLSFLLKFGQLIFKTRPLNLNELKFVFNISNTLFKSFLDFVQLLFQFHSHFVFIIWCCTKVTSTALQVNFFCWQSLILLQEEFIFLNN